MPTSMKGIPFEMSRSKIPARAEPLSTHTNAQVTPFNSSHGRRVDQLGLYGNSIPEVIVTRLINLRLRLAEFRFLKPAR